MLWSISGGAGFLGLHLSRRLLADGHHVRTLDVVPLDDAELERSVDERRGDIRDRESVRKLVDGADVVVHAAAALPIQASRASIRSVNVGGTENVLRAGDDTGVRRVVFISSTAVFGVPE
jgi:nucleoside-diphosphate-sugar epimerase